MFNLFTHRGANLDFNEKREGNVEVLWKNFFNPLIIAGTREGGLHLAYCTWLHILQWCLGSTSPFQTLGANLPHNALVVRYPSHRSGGQWVNQDPHDSINYSLCRFRYFQQIQPDGGGWETEVYLTSEFTIVPLKPHYAPLEGNVGWGVRFPLGIPHNKLQSYLCILSIRPLWREVEESNATARVIKYGCTIGWFRWFPTPFQMQMEVRR